MLDFSLQFDDPVLDDVFDLIQINKRRPFQVGENISFEIPVGPRHPDDLQEIRDRDDSGHGLCGFSGQSAVQRFFDGALQHDIPFVDQHGDGIELIVS